VSQVSKPLPDKLAQLLENNCRCSLHSSRYLRIPLRIDLKTQSRICQLPVYNSHELRLLSLTSNQIWGRLHSKHRCAN